MENINKNNSKSSENTQDLKDFTEELNNAYSDMMSNYDNVENMVCFKSEEYVNIELKKILYLYKIYNNLQMYNEPDKIEKNSILFKNKSNIIFQYFDRKLLMISDPFNQILILNILGLYILKIYGEDITLTTLKYIIRVMLKDESFNYTELDLILKMNCIDLICYYYEIVNHLNNLLKPR